MPETTRTFIALPIPPALSPKLTRLQSQLAPAVPEARWVTTHPFHVTLAFLGDVHNTDLNAVCKAVERAVAGFPVIELRLEGVGAFPDASRPRVIWSGLSTTEPSILADLQKAIVKATAAAGYRPDDARFTPHATLGRIRSDRRRPRDINLTTVLEPLQSWSGGAFTVREVVTFSSSLSSEGPVYAALARAPLAAKKTGERA